MDTINQQLYRIRKQEQYRSSLIKLQHQHSDLYKKIELADYDPINIIQIEEYFDTLQTVYSDAIDLFKTKTSKI